MVRPLKYRGFAIGFSALNHCEAGSRYLLLEVGPVKKRYTGVTGHQDVQTGVRTIMVRLAGYERRR